MNWLDFAIIALIIGVVVAAYSAGLIREVVTLTAAIVGIVLATILYDDFADKVLTFFDNRDTARAVSFLILSGAVYLLGQITAYGLKKFASLMMLGPADHLGGALFGLLKGLLIVQILLIVFAAYPGLELDNAVAGSGLAPYFIDDASFILELLPNEFDQRIDQFLNPTAAPSQ